MNIKKFVRLFKKVWLSYGEIFKKYQLINI